MVSYKYAKINSDFKKLNIVGVLLGGSILYRYQELGNIDKSKDWDGIILVEHKSDIVTLVNVYRNELCDLLDIEYEEFPELKVPTGEDGTSSAVYNSFDGVRFAGWTSNHIKKGTKILSVDHLTHILKDNRPSLINILSYKDVRVAHHQTHGGILQQHIQQATRINDKLSILHIMDIFRTDPCLKHNTHAATFGSAADLFVTGTWVYDNGTSTGDRIARDFFLKFHKIHTAPLNQARLMSTFRNCSKFQPRFRRDLETRLAGYYEDTKNTLMQLKSWNRECVDNLISVQYCYWGDLPEVLLYGVEQENRDKTFKSPKCIESKHLNFHKVFNPQFSSNSLSGYCGKQRKIFWKQTKFLADELAGSKLVSRYYRFTQIPHMVDLKQQIIFYPFFEGLLLNALRLECFRDEFISNTVQSDFEPIILSVELLRSEDILRAYCASAKMSEASVDSEKQFPGSQIHRFYYHRIRNDARLQEFYKNGIDLQESHLTVEELKNLNLIVNGKVYGKLRDIIEKATELLNPSSFRNNLVVCGLGDGHGGNLLVGKQKQPNSTYKYLHIDYEIAGFHCPILDLAKPFYNDVFFNVLYSSEHTTNDELYTRKIVQLEYSEEKQSTLKIDFSLPKSLISKAIYEIKKRYILLPFLKFVENNPELQVSTDWASTFGHALFCCAILAKNFSSRPDVFYANLALGVMLTSVNSFDDLDSLVNDLLS